MSSDSRTFVIVGGGMAGAKAAETLREEGFAGRVVLVGEEAERPYERPPLSKDYLRGESEREPLHVHPAGFYDEHSIELRTRTRATALHPDAREVELDTGERLGFDALLLSPGAEARRLPIPGAELDGVHTLRSVDDSDALRERLARGGRLVVVGAGWIGAEVAASARQSGMDVTVIEPLSVPLERVLGAQLGAFYRDVHLEHGVTMLLGTGVEAFEGSGGAVQAVRTSDGRTIGCDAVIVGVGVKPRTELAEAAGLAIGDGVLVDERLETSVPGIFAAGDVAAHQHPRLGRLRVEHWATALNQGPAAARSMLGSQAPYEHLPYFFSDQYDVGMEYSGVSRSSDRVVLRGEEAGREFIAFWLRDGRVVAGMNVNVWDVQDDVRALIERGEPVDEQRLRDPGVPLGDLLTART